MAGHRAWGCQGRVRQQASPTLPREELTEVEDDIIDINEESITEYIPNVEYYEKAKAMIANYMELGDDLARHSHSSFCLDIYIFSCENSLSTKSGDNLLQLFRRVDTAKQYPRYEALKDFAHSFGKKHFPIIPFEYRIPSVFSDHEAVAFRGHHLNILDVLTDMLLHVNLDDLHLAIPKTHGVSREPATGVYFKQLQVRLLSNIIAY